jgi:hypothetical protein
MTPEEYAVAHMRIEEPKAADPSVVAEVPAEPATEAATREPDDKLRVWKDLAK